MGKVLVLANNDVGLYKFRKELLQKLLCENEVYISLPYGNHVKPLQDMGCYFMETPVDRRGINPKTDFELLVHYRKLIRDLKPDLVITYTIKPNIYGGVASRWAKVPYAVNITGLGTAFQKDGVLKFLVTKMYRYACKKAKTVFFENVDNYKTLLNNRIVTENQAVVLPGAGVNLEEYPYVRYPDSSKGYHFLFIGRVMQEKGIEELFKTAKRICAERENVCFDIVGPYEDDYKKVIEELEKEKIISYHGYQEDVKPFIAASHCFVLPSWHEGMANTLLECASMGRPLITSDIHGCMEAVEEGKNGYLCPIKDSESLYHRITEFLKLEDSEKEKWGCRSRKRMEEIFDKKAVVEKTMSSLGL